jgi:hypothetical protein
LENVLRDSGLNIQFGAYYFGLVFPIAACMRIFERFFKRSQIPQSQLKKHNVIVNNMLKIICKLEIGVMRFNRMAGLTVICLAVKR